MIRAHQKSFHRLYMFVDILLVEVSFVLSYFLRFNLIPIGITEEVGYKSLAEYSYYLIYIMVGYFLIFLFGGLYNSQRSRSLRAQILNVVKVNIYGVIYVFALLYLFREIDISRGFLGAFAMVNTMLDSIFRIALTMTLRKIRKNGKNLKHVLLVGYSRTAESYIDRILANPQWGYSVVGILDNQMEVGTRYKGAKVIGKPSEIEKIFEANPNLDEVVITLRVNEYEILDSLVNRTEKAGLHVRFAPDFKNIMSSDAEMEDMDGVPVINIRRLPLESTGHRFVKRTEDLVLGLLALIIAGLPMLIIALLVKKSSKGPVIYKQQRIGLHNREFTMYKFRSMCLQDEKEEKIAWTTENDDRVTKIGKFIRKTSLDELPQLFNVIKGDMSLVGPRPERPFFVDKFKEEIPRYMVKHQVRPGITGWAQVNGYRGDTSITRRIDYDLWYIENWSLWLDFVILIKTIFHTKDYNAY